jgi:hypothetical protein
MDELRRLKEYSGLSPSPVNDGTVPSGGSYLTSLARGTRATLELASQLAVAWPFKLFMQTMPSNRLSRALTDHLWFSDDDDEDDDWEDRMDPVTFARYYAASSPHLAKIVQEHD